MDKQLIAQNSDMLKLLNVVLYESSLKQFVDIHDHVQLGQQNKLAIRAEIGEAFNSKNSSIDFFRVFVDLGIRVNDLSATGAEPQLLYQIEATFKIDYELINSADEKTLTEFAHVNAVHTIWPFWRQFVFSTAHQAHLPCPEIPLTKML